MFKSIVCAIGRGSRARMEKLIEASHQMLAPNGNLYLVHAVEGLPSSSVRSPDGWAVGVIADTENRLTELLHEAGQQAFIRVRAGNPSDVIVSVAKDVGADLVVIGAHRDDVLEHIFGSVVDHVIQRAPCSVLVLRPGT